MAYLSRISLRSGLLAHMHLFRDKYMPLLADEWHNCRVAAGPVSCRRVCLEWFMKSNVKRASWLLKLANYCYSAPRDAERLALEMTASLNALEYSSHATQHNTSTRDELLLLAPLLDTEHFGGAYAALPSNELCRSDRRSR